MTYCIYHVPGVKIGVTNNIKYRVEQQQGYRQDEYEILEMSDDINYISKKELYLQKLYGYRVDEKPYNKLKCNQMKINVTEMTTTFPCPVRKLKGQLMDNVGMSWQTEYGECSITKKSIEWIMQNVKSSQYTNERCYIYNRAFARWFDNNDPYMLDNAQQMNGVEKRRTLTGGLYPVGVRQQNYRAVAHFDLIREWANERGLYDKGDPKTQYIKLMEETGEIGRAILKNNTDDIVDGIGDAVVVLTNLAELVGVPIEECIEAAYDEIKNRTGKMVNGTFKKD
tara:strand:+ start:27 stop:872 length:846 start_codon:yes stop_codon:yes gene_type:complete